MPKLPEFDKFVAPWEKDLKDGEEPKIDPAALKRHLYNLMSDKEKAQEARDAADKKAQEAESKLGEKTREGESEAEKTARELKDAQDKAAKAETTALEGLKWKVALENGLTAVQAKRLVGKTEEELTADAEALKADLGITTKENGEEDESGDATPRTQPKALRNGGDPARDTPNFDPDKAADEILAGRASF